MATKKAKAKRPERTKVTISLPSDLVLWLNRRAAESNRNLSGQVTQYLQEVQSK